MDRKDLEFVCVFIRIQWNAIRNNELCQYGIGDSLIRWTAQYGVRTKCTNGLGTVLHHEGGGFGQGSRRVTHIIDDDHVLAADVTDDGHVLDFVGHFALLITNGHVHAKVLGIGVRTLCAACIGGGNAEVFAIQPLEVRHKHGARIQVIHRNLEESLNLVRVQVHGDQTVDARSHEQVGHQLGSNGHTTSPTAPALKTWNPVGSK